MPQASMSRADLQQAWERIYLRDLRDDALSAGVRGFARDADDALDRLAASLTEGTWHPGVLTPVDIPKRNGGVRRLHVPTVADRIVETVLHDRLAPRIDPNLGPWCYAFRAGLGVADAVHAVTAWRANGVVAVVRADVADCFPSFNRRMVADELLPYLRGTEVAMIDTLLARSVWVRGGRPAIPARGIPQGSPLSPLLANLVLRQVDEALVDDGFDLVRYADDIAVGCRTAGEARSALIRLRRALEELELRVGDDTEIMSFEQGFVFIGEEFGPRYPPFVQGFKTVEALGRTLYVARPGARVSVSAGQVTVDADDTEVLAVPTGHVARLALFGPTGLSAGARSWALANGVDIILCSQRGNYLGQIVGPGTATDRRLAQADLRHEATWRLPLARALIAGKLEHQVTMLRRFNRPDVADDIRSVVFAIRRLIDMLPQAQSASEIMGLEGAAARAYYDAWPRLLPSGLTFSGRNRRPPLDTANAALSWCYTVLHGETVGALAAAGLDPAIGVLHEPADRQFALANDLMEEFRPLVVDAAIFALARAGDLRDEHGRAEGGGVLLTVEGRRRVAGAFENRMTTAANGALPDFRGSYRRLLHEQARRLAACIDGATNEWQPLAWR